jgi:hypothetical protein
MLRTGRGQVAGRSGGVIAPWLRTTVILALLGVWIVYIAAQLIRDREIDSVVWGIPGGFFLLLGPGLKGYGNNDNK